MDLDSAIHKHAEWKTKLRAAMAKRESMDVGTISHDDCCELGKWLHGHARVHLGQFVSYGECLRKHAAFHVQAGKVAAAINAERYVEAEAMLGAGTAYAEASRAVGVAIMHLKKDAAI